jgi:hypothetical protein
LFNALLRANEGHDRCINYDEGIERIVPCIIEGGPIAAKPKKEASAVEKVSRCREGEHDI